MLWMMPISLQAVHCTVALPSGNYTGIKSLIAFIESCFAFNILCSGFFVSTMVLRFASSVSRLNSFTKQGAVV